MSELRMREPIYPRRRRPEQLDAAVPTPTITVNTVEVTKLMAGEIVTKEVAASAAVHYEAGDHIDLLIDPNTPGTDPDLDIKLAVQITGMRSGGEHSFAELSDDEADARFANPTSTGNIPVMVSFKKI